MPKTVVTPELKRDLQLLRLRSVLDPKRFYKKDSARAEVPEYSQVGTVIEGPTEFFSSRLTNKERKQTFVEQVLAGEKANHKFRNKYNDIQAAKASGKKEHYKKMKALRKRRWAHCKVGRHHDKSTFRLDHKLQTHLWHDLDAEPCMLYTFKNTSALITNKPSYLDEYQSPSHIATDDCVLQFLFAILSVRSNFLNISHPPYVMMKNTVNSYPCLKEYMWIL